MEDAGLTNRLHRLPWRGLSIFVVGLMIFGWLLSTPAGLLGKADAVGYAVCHRIDQRSFHLGDRQTPLCARCSGMYLGALLGMLYQWRRNPRRSGMPPARVLVVLAIFLLAFGIDGVNSYLYLILGRALLYEPQNWLRLLTGTGMGLVIAAAIVPAFNQTVWINFDNLPALNGLRSLGNLCVLAVLLDLLVLTENPLILYPLALISAAGVLILLTMIYTMVWLMVLRVENRFHSLTQLLFPLVGGLGVAMVQIILLDWLRFLLTHSWGGFSFG